MGTNAGNAKEKSERTKEFNLLLQPQFADFSEVHPNLFLTGIGGMTVDNFRRNRITNIINCTQEAPHWRMKGVESIRVAVDDSPDENILSHLDSIADKINDILTKGGRIVVHCVAGVSRSATVVIAYLMKYHRISLREAFNKVHSVRRVIRPNNGFFKQLMVFEKNLGLPSSCKMVELPKDDVMIEVPDFFLHDHKKFIVLETLKAKAKKMKELAVENVSQSASSAYLPSKSKASSHDTSSYHHTKKGHR